MKKFFDKNGRQVFLHDDHKRPTSRREFLGTGLLGFSGFMMAPSVLTVLSGLEQAHAAGDECETKASNRLPAFISVNLAGGAALAGNYIPLDQGGQLLPSYDVLGMGATPPVEREFQGVGFAGVNNGRLTSQFLAGLRTTASQTTRDKTAFFAVCVPLQDDSNNNKIDPSGLVTAAGLAGELLPKLGMRETPTGVRHEYAMVRPPAPLIVNNINDLTGALTPAGTLATRLDNNQRRSLLSLVSKLSGSQAAAIRSPNSASGSTLAKLVECATGKNVSLAAQTTLGVDPRQDTTVGLSTLWGMPTAGNQFGRSQNERVIMGSMVYNALKGNAGAVGLDIGGYDYHGNNRVDVTDVRDNDAGQLVGKILESAAAMNQKVFIQVQSDGSVGAPRGSDINASFTGDRGAGGMSYILVFDPAGRPASKPGYQIGHFTAGQGAADNSVVGSAEKAGAAVFANYMKFAGQLGRLDSILTQPFNSVQLEQVLRLA